jgi:peptide-methionine (S)-S-oxide reductase
MEAGLHAAPRSIRPTVLRWGGLCALGTVALLASPPLGFGQARQTSAVFAGGCFWGVESVFEHVRGVRSATSGYSGGSVADPSYEVVETGATGHAETVRVVYDPAQVSYRQLLAVFFLVAHDPTTRDRQGPDAGPQYRAIVFYQDSAQQREARSYIAELTAHRVVARPIVTEVRPFQAFYPAESYHQHYAALHPTQPYIVINDAPKLERLRRLFPALYLDGDGVPPPARS